MKSAVVESETNRAYRRFREWLHANRARVGKMKVHQMVTLWGEPISRSSAYRAAIAEGLRGLRMNRTRYAAFWNLINWRLPDSVLSAIWGVTRGNIRTRRVRLGVGDAAYDARSVREHSCHRKEVDREMRIASKFNGLRPH